MGFFDLVLRVLIWTTHLTDQPVVCQACGQTRVMNWESCKCGYPIMRHWKKLRWAWATRSLLFAGAWFALFLWSALFLLRVFSLVPLIVFVLAVSLGLMARSRYYRVEGELNAQAEDWGREWRDRREARHDSSR